MEQDRCDVCSRAAADAEREGKAGYVRCGTCVMADALREAAQTAIDRGVRVVTLPELERAASEWFMPADTGVPYFGGPETRAGLASPAHGEFKPFPALTTETCGVKRELSPMDAQAKLRDERIKSGGLCVTSVVNASTALANAVRRTWDRLPETPTSADGCGMLRGEIARVLRVRADSVAIVTHDGVMMIAWNGAQVVWPGTIARAVPVAPGPSAKLRDAVRRAYAQLIARDCKLPATGDGLATLRSEVAGVLGVSPESVEVKGWHGALAVSWNGVAAMWPDALRGSDGRVATQPIQTPVHKDDFTAEALAAGLAGGEALRRLCELTGRLSLSDNEKIERDELLYGTSYARRRPDGTMEHIPAQDVVVQRAPQPPRAGWGESVLARSASCDPLEYQAWKEGYIQPNYDTTQRPVRTAGVAIVDKAPDSRCRIRTEPTRPDGFAQLRIDEIKMMLTTTTKEKR